MGKCQENGGQWSVVGFGLSFIVYRFSSPPGGKYIEIFHRHS